MKSGGDGIGRALDQFEWDYEPPAVERRFFLKPVSAFFGVFRWEGHNGQFPEAQDPVEDQALTIDE